MNDLSKNLIDKIKKENIAPKARWFFLAKDKLFWLLFGLSIIVGGLSFGVILYFASDNDLITFYWSRQGFVNQVLTTLPYLWLVLIILVSYLASLNLHATKNGYRLPVKNIIFLSILASLVIGTGTYVLGFGSYLDYRFGRFPFYKSLDERRFEFWLQPSDDRLAGKIVKFNNKTDFELLDFQKKTWRVIVNEKTFWSPRITKETGELVRITGEQIDETSFKATEIQPWRRPNFNGGPRPLFAPPVFDEFDDVLFERKMPRNRNR